MPRLIAVVVLPTPPFWFAIAITRPSRGGLRLTITRTSDPPELEHDARGRGQAREHFGHHMPALGGLRSIRRCTVAPLSNRQTPSAARKRAASGKQAGQGRQRARRDDRRGVAGSRSAALGMDGDGGAGRARDLAQELRLAPVALDQRDVRAPRGSPAPGRESRRRCRDRPALRRARADAATSWAESSMWRRQGSARRRRADQIDRPLPARQQLEIAASDAPVFHVKHRSGAANSARLSGRAAPSLRRPAGRTGRGPRAPPGVIPGSRPAAPSVVGRPRRAAR